MEYENELVFAKRVCEIYSQTKDLCKDYQYTHVLTCLLSVISTIRPDGRFVVDVSSVIENKNREEIEKFLVVVRDSMAHHIKENFSRNSTEGQISSVKFAHYKGKNETEEFTIDELDDIMKKLEEAIVKELN